MGKTGWGLEKELSTTLGFKPQLEGLMLPARKELKYNLKQQQSAILHHRRVPFFRNCIPANTIVSRIKGRKHIVQGGDLLHL